eukprot:2493083-Rhodomonas_salina.1
MRRLRSIHRICALTEILTLGCARSARSAEALLPSPEVSCSEARAPRPSISSATAPLCGPLVLHSTRSSGVKPMRLRRWSRRGWRSSNSSASAAFCGKLTQSSGVNPSRCVANASAPASSSSATIAGEPNSTAECSSRSPLSSASSGWSRVVGASQSATANQGQRRDPNCKTPTGSTGSRSGDRPAPRASSSRAACKLSLITAYRSGVQPERRSAGEPSTSASSKWYWPMKARSASWSEVTAAAAACACSCSLSSPASIIARRACTSRSSKSRSSLSAASAATSSSRSVSTFLSTSTCITEATLRLSHGTACIFSSPVTMSR